MTDLNIKLYEYGLDESLKDAVTLLRGAIGNKLSKKDKDVKISEAIGVIDTARFMIDIYDPVRRAKEEAE